MDVVIPLSIEEIIQNFDKAEQPLKIHTVANALNAARQQLTNPSGQENLGAWSEVLAFGLSNTRRSKSPWNTYYGPVMSGTNGDGTPFYSPDIAGADPKVIAHWTSRATSLKHPVLVARYADLIWDLGCVIAKEN